jgi:hypothetical protein
MPAKTTEQWAKELESATGAVGSPQAAPAHMSPPTRLLWLKQTLTALNLRTDFLASAEALAARASQLRSEAFAASQTAGQRRQSALATLGRDQAASLAEAVAQWAAQGPWLDALPGQSPPALDVAEQGARLLEGGIVSQIAGRASQIFVLVQRKAAELVDEVAALPKFADRVWIGGDPSAALARIPEHRSSWGVLESADLDFLRCHEVADSVRDFIGYNADRLPDGAPRLALWARNWRAALHDETYPKLRHPLRLRYAIEKNFQPGLWRPDDIKTLPADRTFGGRLRNTGSAVGIL